MAEPTHEEALSHIGESVKTLRHGMAQAYARGDKRKHDELADKYHALRSLHKHASTWRAEK